MKNRLAAFSRRIIPYNPGFRQLSLVKSVNAALLLQQLDFWFDKYKEFYKFLDSSPNHPMYNLGDSWVEELGFSKEEFRTAFNQIGIAYKSRSDYDRAKEKFVAKTSSNVRVEYYYASYIDRRNNLTYYVRNDQLLDSELQQLIEYEGGDRPEKSLPSPTELKERLCNPSTPVQTLATEPTLVVQEAVAQPKPAKAPKRTPEEIAAEKAAKEEERRLRAEAKAQAERERQEQIDRDNQWRYELFGGKERYIRFNQWFWGTYVKGTNLDKPDMFYIIVLKSLGMGAEKYSYLVAMFDTFEQKQAEAAQIEAVVSESHADDSEEYYVSKLTSEEFAALMAADLEPDLYIFCLRQMEHQTHNMRLKTIFNKSEEQEVRNYRRKLVEGNQ